MAVGWKHSVEDSALKASFLEVAVRILFGQACGRKMGRTIAAFGRSFLPASFKDTFEYVMQFSGAAPNHNMSQAASTVWAQAAVARLANVLYQIVSVMMRLGKAWKDPQTYA